MLNHLGQLEHAYRHAVALYNEGRGDLVASNARLYREFGLSDDEILKLVAICSDDVRNDVYRARMVLRVQPDVK